MLSSSWSSSLNSLWFLLRGIWVRGLKFARFLQKGGGCTSWIIRYLPEWAEDVDEVLAAMQEHRVQAVLEPPTRRTLAAELLRGGEACRFLLVYATFFKVGGFLSFSQISVIEIISFTFFSKFHTLKKNQWQKKFRKNRKGTGQDGRELSGGGRHPWAPAGASSLPSPWMLRFH